MSKKLKVRKYSSLEEFERDVFPKSYREKIHKKLQDTQDAQSIGIKLAKRSLKSIQPEIDE